MMSFDKFWLDVWHVAHSPEGKINGERATQGEERQHVAWKAKDEMRKIASLQREDLLKACVRHEIKVCIKFHV